MDKSIELEHLARADSHIESARRIIAEQEARIASGRLLGRPLEDARALLQTMQMTLLVSEEHRRSITRIIEDLAAGRR